MNKIDFVVDLAQKLVKSGKTMTASQLADVLNKNGYNTNVGGTYSGGRGTLTTVSSIYNELIKQGRLVDADNVAKAFVKEDGNYAYK